MKTLTPEEVREAVKAAVDDIIGDYADKPDTDREEVIESVFEQTDSMFGALVQHGRIDQYNIEDMVRTAQPCATIIKVAEADAWVEDDSGLWEGLTHGVLASMAFFSLERLVYQGLTDRGHDTNADYPFAIEEAATE